MDENPEEVETTNEVEETEETEDVDALREQLAEVEKARDEAIEAKRQLTARANKAETENKAFKAKPVEEKLEETNALSADDIDVKILQSQGEDEDTIAYLKKLAKLNGTSLLAAKSDELFIGYKDKKEREEKAKKASVGASKGSGSSQKGKSTTTPNLSAEDHKELWRKQNER